MTMQCSSVLCWTEVEKSRSNSGMKHLMYDNPLLAIPSVSEGSILLAGKERYVSNRLLYLRLGSPVGGAAEG